MICAKVSKQHISDLCTMHTHQRLTKRSQDGYLLMRCSLLVEIAVLADQDEP